MKKKNMLKVLAAAMAVVMAAGCGSTAAPATEEVKEEAEAVEEAADEGQEVVTPFLADLEKYDEVISGLRADQYYAFADACEDYDLLLVTDGVYDYDGVNAAIDATVYGFDADGNVIELGTIMSEGTAYPISVKDGCLMYGGNHHMAMTFVKDGSMITKLDADEVFDENGNATYYLFDLDEHFEGEVEDNTKLNEMYDAFAEATMVNFNQAGGGEDKADSQADSQAEVYESADGWKVNYDPEKFFLNDTLDDGEIAFNYIGECSGTTAVVVSYVKDKMPDEALYEKVSGYDDAQVERGECRFGKDDYWAHYRHIKPENEDPAVGDVVYEGFTGIEHNGGTVIIESIEHGETDDAQYNEIEHAMGDLLGSFELVNHEPQTEYAYMIGTYTRDYKEEMEGEELEFQDMVTLNEDHTCEVSFQDTIQGEWTGTMITLNDGSAYELSVEGDNLYLNMSEEWTEFHRVK